jgi:hypothetical protein
MFGSLGNVFQPSILNRELNKAIALSNSITLENGFIVIFPSVPISLKASLLEVL